MAAQKGKRAADKEERQRNVRARVELQPLGMVIVTNMEPIRLEICWSPSRQREFRNAQVYEFLRRSEHLPPIDAAVVEEYVRNYDPEDGSSQVRGRTVEVDAAVLKEVLHLPICEMEVGGEVSTDFRPDSYFKSGLRAFEKNQGWKVAEALTPELGEWMRFVLKRLGLNRHSTYMSKKLLYAAIGTLEGMLFNWAAFVAIRMHAELELKRKQGKCVSLLCSNYVCAAVMHVLGGPMQEREGTGAAGAPRPCERGEAPAEVRPSAGNASMGECSSRGPRRSPIKELAGPGPAGRAAGAEQDVPGAGGLRQLAGRTGLVQHGTGLKAVLLAQIHQLQTTASRLEDESSLRKELEKGKELLEEKNGRLAEVNGQLRDAAELNARLERQYLAFEDSWSREKQLLLDTIRIEKQERAELLGKWEGERRKVAELERDRKRVGEQLAKQKEASHAEIAELRVTVANLQKDLGGKERDGPPVQSAEGVEGLKQRIEQQQTRLDAQNTRLLQLESQMRELGTYNEELTAQLRKGREGSETTETDSSAEADGEEVEQEGEGVPQGRGEVQQERGEVQRERGEVRQEREEVQQEREEVQREREQVSGKGKEVAG